MASMPPTARTANTASTMTMPILMTNWKRSVTSTPHNPERVEMNEVRAIMPMTMARACSFVDAQHQLQDLDHGQVDPAEDDAVDRNAEVKRAEAAQERGGFAGIADFAEFDVGHDAGAPPQAGVEEDGEHAAGDEVPPQPVACDAAHRHHAGDGQRRVGGEGGGDHGGAGQPPGDVAAGEEKLIDVLAGARFVVEADGEVEEEVKGDYQPVDGGELHT